MRGLLKIRDFYKKYTPQIILSMLVILLAISLANGQVFQNGFSKIINTTTFLIWHNTIEVTSVVIAVIVFCVSYYTYEQTKNFRYLFIGSFMLLMAFIDYFHFMSYYGMPEFFSPNITNKATTYWIIARLVGGIGFFIAGFVSKTIKFKIKKIVFFIVPLILSIFILIIVSFYPKFLPPMFLDGKGLTETKKILEYIIILLNVGAVLLFIRLYIKTKDIFTIFIAGALIVGAFSELAFTFYTNVYDVYNYLGHLYKVIMYFIIFRVIFIKNVKKPFLELSEARDQIKNYADNQDKIVEQRTQQINEIYKKLLDDLEYARGIQMSMMPQSLPQSKRATFETGYFPAEMIGGDFYNIIQLEANKVGVYIGDVSGHGVSAAMLTVFVNQSIKLTKEVTPGITEILKPSEVLTNLNLSYNKTNFNEDVYLVMFYGIYDLETKEFTFASAGMNVSPMVIKSSGEVFDVDIKGFPICKLLEFSNDEYKNATIQFNSGDKVLFYTDGLVDAVNNYKQGYDNTRLNNIIRRIAKMSAAEISVKVYEDIDRFVKKRELKDDITYIIMEIK